MQKSISEEVVSATKSWVEQIIIGLNFCPFAKKEWVNNTIHYHVSDKTKLKVALSEFYEQCQKLLDEPALETTLLIYSDGFKSFDAYLDLVDYANDLLADLALEGVFQLASFHPEYAFADEDYDDAANFTNRSPYPMLHIIREASMERVLSVYKNPEAIPDNNIRLAREKGSTYFQNLLKSFHHK